MSRKIVAIGGGENGRKRSNGTRHPYKNYFYSYKYITPWTNGKKTEVDTLGEI
jgi:hypothetical protein